MAKFINIEGIRIHADLIDNYKAGYDGDLPIITIELEEDFREDSMEDPIKITFDHYMARDAYLKKMDEILGTGNPAG